MSSPKLKKSKTDPDHIPADRLPEQFREPYQNLPSDMQHNISDLVGTKCDVLTSSGRTCLIKSNFTQHDGSVVNCANFCISHVQRWIQKVLSTFTTDTIIELIYHNDMTDRQLLLRGIIVSIVCVLRQTTLNILFEKDFTGYKCWMVSSDANVLSSAALQRVVDCMRETGDFTHHMDEMFCTTLDVNKFVKLCDLLVSDLVKQASSMGVFVECKPSYADNGCVAARLPGIFLSTASRIKYKKRRAIIYFAAKFNDPPNPDPDHLDWDEE